MNMDSAGGLSQPLAGFRVFDLTRSSPARTPPRRSPASPTEASPTTSTPEARTVIPSEPLLLTREGTVATLTFNRPERLNAISYTMFLQLPKLVDEAKAMPGLRALMLRGAGTRAFSAG